MPSKRWAIKVVWQGGEEEFLKEESAPNSRLALFYSRKEADEHREFMLEGMDGLEFQSINVVPAPKMKEAPDAR